MNKKGIEIKVYSKEEKVIYVINLPEPSLDEIKKYSDIFNDKSENKKYYQHEYEKDLHGKCDNTIKEELLERTFQDNQTAAGFSPNKNLSDILIKVTLLNAYYNTRIDNNMLVPIARQIFALDIDGKLAESVKNGKANCDLVNAIAYCRDSVSKNEKINAAYSFASKYCSWHCPKLYPILDSYVKGLLFYINESYEDENNRFITYPNDIFSKRSKEISSKNKFLNDYENYYNAYMEFVKKYNLNNYSEIKFKKIDEYLWMLTQDELTDENCYIEMEENGIVIKKEYSVYKHDIDEKNCKEKEKNKKYKDKKIAKKISQVVKLDGNYDGMYKKIKDKENKEFKNICDNCKSIEE